VGEIVGVNADVGTGESLRERLREKDLAEAVPCEP
jgi:hypothetical protein